MIQGSQITALVKMAGGRSDRPAEWWLQRLKAFTGTLSSPEKAEADGDLSTKHCRFREIINLPARKHFFSFVLLCLTLILDDASLERWFTLQHLQSRTHTHTQTYRSQTAHCALWPSMGRVGLGSSGNQEDRPSPLSHNEGLITGPASLKSHGSRLPVSVLRSPNILIALLFSLCFYRASLADSLLLSPQPFRT